MSKKKDLAEKLIKFVTVITILLINIYCINLYENKFKFFIRIKII